MPRNNPQNPTTNRPQNKSYPAGGASKVNHTPKATTKCQRGVIVAPPSGNTSNPTPEPQVVHMGFDTMAIAIQANIPPDLFAYLETEKERADKERRDVLVEFNGIKLHLKAHGGKGYRFIASGGPDGATWFFKKPNTRDKWGIRVSFGSYFLAFYGLAAAHIHLDQVLEQLGVRFGDNDVSISRVDFCVDVLSPDFELIPDKFVMHSSAGRRDYIRDSEKSVHGKSGRTSSVTIGSPRNRQVIVYDKRAEVISRGKTHWWGIWNHNLRKLGLPELNPRNAKSSQIWRLEFRAGKDLLKDRWNIRTWKQLYERFGDLCRETGELIRYTEPSSTDPNRARWPNHLLWELVCAEINADMLDMRSGCDPNPMKEVRKEEHIALITRNILGCSLTVAALKGVPINGLKSFFSVMSEELTGQVRNNPERVQKKLNDAKERYVFIPPEPASYRN
jgi:hypothetical protein